MSYQTGSAANPAALQAIIENFCVANGFTLNAGAGSWLSKGQSHIHFSGANTTTLTLSGANSADGTTELCPFTKSIYITAGSWPVTYHLFYDTNPDQVSCVLNYEGSKIQVIMFGDIVKIHNNAYVGGNWFFASKYDHLTLLNEIASITDNIIAYGYENNGDGGSSPIAFVQECITGSSDGYSNKGTALHCKIDSNVWGSIGVLTKLGLTDSTISSLFRSPNTWNNQAQLVPIQLRFTMSSGVFGYLGYVKHLRYVRIDNYEIGDIITLGSDKWKVFPWGVKNITYRNGIFSSGSPVTTGTLGFACRYTP